MSDEYSDPISSIINPKDFSPPNEKLISNETRNLMSQMLEFSPPPRSPKIAGKIPLPFSRNPPLPVESLRTDSLLPVHLNSIAPSLVTLANRILEELDSHLDRLLSLNPSRREAVAHHLDRLCNQSHPSATGGLRRWVEEPRTNAQNAALKIYFEELAVIALGQALLLKCWSDRGIRKWSESDIGRLNWALSSALKPHVPLDREGWQITKPNLYSWYNPGPRIQNEIWTALSSWHVTDEGPSFFIRLLSSIRILPSESEPHGYDSRFFKGLWDHMEHFGFHTDLPSLIPQRSTYIFSPTLREGSLVRKSPASLTWIGLEASPFQLMLAELMQIWWGPSAPPFWSIGTGLEVHARDQLALDLGAPKPSVVSRIAEMEACHAAFVLEEQIVRTQGRSLSAARFREHLEKLPYFKRLKSSGTSLGSLQACVSLTKLRPGGVLLWSREEALSSKDGPEVLNFFLERAKLICEWDFSELEHSLPSTTPLYPKHLYLFQREPQIEARLSHRPVKHSIQGQLRSHVELPLLLEDAFHAKCAEEPTLTRGHWTILSHSSPTSQQEWVEKWPDPTSQTVVRLLDQLRTHSLPLANFTTIRLTPEGDGSKGGKWSVHLSLKGFWLSAGYDTQGRKLNCQELPTGEKEAQGTGFLILVPDELWVAPLCAYLTSPIVQKWLEYHAERRGERWILNEQGVKWIPVPKTLLKTLGVPNALEGPSLAGPLPGDWEKLGSEVTYQPQMVQKALQNIEHPIDEETLLKIHASIFVRASRALNSLHSGQNRLFSMVTEDGLIRWKELLEVLPKSECVSLSLHPQIRLSGSLPPHLPIGKMDRVKLPMPGILLATETGFTLHIGTENTLLLKIIWEQLEGLSHPTWNELLHYLRIPRKVNLAESTALDVLRSHEEQISRLKELQSLLDNCRFF